MGRVVSSFVLGCLLVASAYAEIYKSVDEDGRVIFSDRQTDNSEQIEAKEAQTIQSVRPQRLPPLKKTPKVERIKYDISIVSPAEPAFRDNTGNVTISVVVMPELRASDELVISLDGAEISRGHSLSVSLENVDRGTHTIVARIIDYAKQEIASSSHQFTLIRDRVKRAK